MDNKLQEKSIYSPKITDADVYLDFITNNLNNDETNNMRGFSYTNDGGIHIGWSDLRADAPKLKTSLGRL